MEWTLNQSKVINTRNKNILVSAAAGSGKTAVLVERIIRLVIDNKENIDSFLIVTFTNAAAAGMKQKIQKAVYSCLEDEALTDKSVRIHLRNQLNLINKANISTIHSFCIDVLRKNFHVLGIDPDFRIGDPNECQILLNESIDEVLENAYTTKSDEFVQLIESFTGNRSDIELVDIIKDMYYFVLSFPNPLEWLNDSIEQLNTTKDKLEKSLWLDAIRENLNTLLDGAIETLDSCKELCLEDNGPLVYLEAIDLDIKNIEALKESLVSGFDVFIESLYSISHPRLASIRGKAKDTVDEAKIAEAKSLRDEYKKIIDSLKKLIPDKTMNEFAEDVAYMYPAMKAIFTLVSELMDVFRCKKSEKAIIDFGDVEHMALSALSNEEIGSVYRSKFKFIFVDEYQDSNQLQETLLGTIKRDNNMFMVGDSKQSIYKFRLADVDLFNSKMETYKLDCPDGDINQRIDLNHNFRSRPEILAATNFVFSKIMSKKLGELDYNKDVYLNAGMDFVKASSPSVELNIIESTFDDDIDEVLQGMETAEIEAHFAAGKIKALLEEKTYNAKTGELKAIEFKDIVILLRSASNWSGVFEEVFFSEGIPFYSDTGTGYYETIEIQIMIDLLKLIDNTRQDIPLLSTMRSPIGKFTTDELIKIRIKSPAAAFIDAIYNYINSESNELSDKISGFIKLIERYKKESRYKNLSDLIWQILMETDYYYFVGALPNGKMRQANLRLLTDKAYDYEKTSMTGLYNFLKYIDKLKLSNTDEATAKILGENDNVVRLMTIHKSKGLEFQVVILCGLNKRFNMMDISKSILKHKSYGIAPKYVNPSLRIYKETLPRIALKNVSKLETLSEEMRVLYVALTRAVDKLIMCGTLKSAEVRAKKWRKGTTHYNLYSANSYLDWICCSLYNHKDADILRELTGDDSCNVKEDRLASSWQINIFDISDINCTAKDAQEERTDRINEIKNFAKRANSNLTEEISRRLSYEYSYKESVNVPTKLSVTDIKNLYKHDKNIGNIKINIPKLVDIPMFKEKQSEFTKAEIGTITHYVMQHLNITGDLTEEGINNQIADMVTCDLLTASEAEAVNINQIAAFFTSDIGKRMKASKMVRRETPFVIKKQASEVVNSLENSDMILIQGIIDCYFYEGDDIVVLDYKTDAVYNNVNEIKRQYEVQILAYRDALEKLTGRAVKECYLYLFDINEQIPIIG